MGELPQIINTSIITSDQDVFWASFPAAEGMEPRPVLIISHDFQQGSAEEDQLNGIIRAGCKLTEDKYNVIQLKGGENAPWVQIREHLRPSVVLLFGISPSQLGISALFRLNEVNKFNQRIWVPTVSLSHLMQDKNLKGQLWNNALKPVFEGKAHGDVLVTKG